MAPALPKKKLSKSKLSMYLRTQCDRELYLSLFSAKPEEMASAGLPVPLKSRPNVQLVTGAGNEFEHTQFQMLVKMLVGHVRYAPKFAELNLKQALTGITAPTLCLQPGVEPQSFRVPLLTDLGVTIADQKHIPPLAGMRPDVILVDVAKADDWEVLCSGGRKRISSGETRLALSVIDLKNVAEGNSSYAAEVCLYAIILANWLRFEGLQDSFYVSEKTYLWTTPVPAEFDALFKGNPTAPGAELIAALMRDLEREAVDFLQFVPSVRKFFAQDVPRVVKTGDLQGWQAVEIHVGSRCNACDWLGKRDWLSPVDAQIFDANPGHYCMHSTQVTGHLSRIANLSRGARRVLEAGGTKTVAALQLLPVSAPVLSGHSFLKKHRSGLSAKATALSTNVGTPGLTSKLTSIAKNVELRVCVVVTFDASAGRLTGLGIRSDVLPPFGHKAQLKHLDFEGYMVERNTDEAEWLVLSQFIDAMVKSAEDGAKHLDPNAKPMKLPYAQIYFWEPRQYEELCAAFGRHLPRVFSLPTGKQRAMAWLFPADDLLEREDGAVSPSIVFVKDLVERAMHLPVPHVTTLLGTVVVYAHPKLPALKLDTFYSEPLSNGIPRERTFEIWTNTSGVVEWGKTVKQSLSAVVERYRKHLRGLAYSLNSIVARLDQDFRTHLKGRSQRLDLSESMGPKGLAFDSKLWVQWNLLDHATQATQAGAALGASGEELEARYEAIVLTKMLVHLGGHRYRYQVSADSKEAKFDVPDHYLTFGVSRLAGFPLENGYSLQLNLVDPSLQPKDLKMPMYRVMKASLLAFDRGGGTVDVEFGPSWQGVAGIFNAVCKPSVVNFKADELYLVKGIPYDSTADAEEILEAVGDPSNSKADGNALKALGKLGKAVKAGTTAPSTLSRLLWEAPTRAKAPFRSPAAAKTLASAASKIAVRPLNASQKAAVQAAAQFALTMIWGPPGTGKTDTLAAFLAATVRESIETGTFRKVLISGPNYRAVEVLADRLLGLLALDASAKCDFYRAYSKSRELPIGPLLPSHVKGANVSLDPAKPEYIALSQSLNAQDRVTIVATSAHAARKVSEVVDDNVLAPVFDIVVIDESSQVPLTLALLPMATLRPESQLVVAGDRLQMPPIASLDAPLGAEYLVGSIQSYFKERFNVPERELLENYRSNQAIVDYALTLGYPANLKAAKPTLGLHELTPRDMALGSLPASLPKSTAWSALLDPDKAVCTLIHEDETSSQANPEEAKMVAALVWGLFKSMSVELDPLAPGRTHQPPTEKLLFERVVGIVTPHKAQRALILNELLALFPSLTREDLANAVDTVEKFQGGQRQTIIVSFGVGDVEIIEGEEFFLLQLERINVAVSRAEAKCIVVMPRSLAYHLPTERKTIKTAKAIKSYLETFCDQRASAIATFPGGTTRVLDIRWHQS